MKHKHNVGGKLCTDLQKTRKLLDIPMHYFVKKLSGELFKKLDFPKGRRGRICRRQYIHLR